MAYIEFGLESLRRIRDKALETRILPAGLIAGIVEMEFVFGNQSRGMTALAWVWRGHRK
jgi:hypothetical protein